MSRMPEPGGDFDGREEIRKIDCEIGKQIALARASTKLSAKYVADSLGMRPCDYEKIESGGLRADAETLCNLSDLLKFPVSYFYSTL
jgi:transcriptional regulator with XRE-family HTH domain